MNAVALLIVLIVGVSDVAVLWSFGGGARVLALLLAVMVLAGLRGLGAEITACLLVGATAWVCWEAGR